MTSIGYKSDYELIKNDNPYLALTSQLWWSVFCKYFGAKWSYCKDDHIKCISILFDCIMLFLTMGVVGWGWGWGYQDYYLALGPLLLTWIKIIAAWLSNHIHYEMWDEINGPFPNFSVGTIEVWEWINDFTSHITGHVISNHDWIKVNQCWLKGCLETGPYPNWSTS